MTSRFIGSLESLICLHEFVTQQHLYSVDVNFYINNFKQLYDKIVNYYELDLTMQVRYGSIRI